jgi:NADH-quinone oxidoreductase subunit J
VSTIVWFFASVAAIASAGAVVLQRNPFVSAIALIGHFAALATLYLLLQADFVAAAQVIVYAGAVMVMFLFVIAYVGPRGEAVPQGGSPRRLQTWAALVAGGAILVEVALAVGRAGLDSPASTSDSFGSPQNVGTLFFTRYVGAFEIVSLLLLVAAVAAVVLGAGPRPARVSEATSRDDGDARRRASAELVASLRQEETS